MKNPSAFPLNYGQDDMGTPNCDEGMTLLDYFAAKVLPEVIASERWGMDKDHASGSVWANDDSYFANRSYQLAEAMLEERQKRIKDGT